MGDPQPSIAKLAGTARAAASVVRARMIGETDVEIAILDDGANVLARTHGTSEFGSEFALAAVLHDAGVRVETWACEERPDGNILTAAISSMRR